MIITWKKNKNLNSQLILDSIDGSKTISADGQVSFSGMGLQSEISILKTAIKFPDALGDMDKYRLIWLSISDVAKAKKLEKDNLMAAINDRAKIENRTKQTEFAILTSISVKKPFPNKLMKIESCTVDFLDGEYPSIFQNRHAAIEDTRFEPRPKKNNYQKIIITSRARSPALAVTAGLRALDLQRAIWCLIANYDMQMWGNEWEPINRIRLGQVHTAHALSGVCDPQAVWYEPNFTEAVPFSPDDNVRFETDCDYVRTQLAKSKYSGQLKNGLIRYVRALDERDQNVAVLKLWGAIEQLAAPGEFNVDSVPRRCSFLFKDTAYHKQMLEHLRDYRNESVHAGDQSDSAKIHCFNLQFYFRQLIFFHLREAETFDSLAMANQFLDMPSDKVQLDQRKKLIEKALHFID